MDIEIQDPEEEKKTDVQDKAGSGDEAEGEAIETTGELPDEDEDEGENEAEEADEADEEEGEESDPGSNLEAEIEKWRDRALRNQADLENYRKRMAREKTEAVHYANVSLLRSLLPILDNFEMGLRAARDESEESVIYQGMAMVRKQIDEFLSEEGVEPVESTGAEFDPNRHEAVQQEWSDDEPEGAIIGELRRGYRMGERLLRPANVIVSKGPRPDPEDGEIGEEEAEAGEN